MMVKKKDEMTLDKLALMVARGFEAVDKRFDKVDRRFARVDLDLSELHQSASFVKAEVKETNFRLSNLEYKVGELTKNNKEDLNAFAKDILRLKQKVGVK